MERHRCATRSPVSYSHILFAFCFAWFVDGAARGFAGAGGRLLALPPLRYLGRISYGLYLFHGPLGEGGSAFLSRLRLAISGALVGNSSR